MTPSMNTLIKSVLKPVYRFWPIQLTIRGCSILYSLFVYQPLHRKQYRKDLEKFKNIHKGKRCFIVATGPSLTIEDVNKLKDEYSFGVNSVCKLFNETDWRPTYYAIIDPSIYDRMKDDLKNVDMNCAFFPDERFRWKNPHVHYIPIKAGWCSNAQQRKIIPDKWRKIKFGEDMTIHFYEGTSVVHFIMQIAFYMGFSEIYLIGTDCTNPTQHSTIVTYKDSEKIGNSAQDIYNGLMNDYQIAKEVADKRGIRIYNATRGGALEKFERVDLDEVLRCKQ